MTRPVGMVRKYSASLVERCPRASTRLTSFKGRRVFLELLLPILLHCTDDGGRPMLGPTRPGPEGEEFLRTAYHGIPEVEPVLREYWMPQRARS